MSAADALMLQVLAEMSVISEVRARSYDGVSVHGGERSGVPALSDKPMVDYWRDRYNRAVAEASKCAVLEDARKALDVARRAFVPEGQPPMPDSPLWKRWVAESPLPSVEIARLFGVSRQYIHRIRVDYADR